MRTRGHSHLWFAVRSAVLNDSADYQRRTGSRLEKSSVQGKTPRREAISVANGAIAGWSKKAGSAVTRTQEARNSPVDSWAGVEMLRAERPAAWASCAISGARSTY